MNGIELQDREFIAAIREGREPNASVTQVLPCYQVLDRIEHGMVLGGGRDHMAPPGALPCGRAEDGEVVALGGTRGKYDFFGTGLDERGYLSASCFDDCFGFPSVGMSSRMGVTI